MISVHPTSKLSGAGMYKYGWEIDINNDIDHVANVISSYDWCPMVFNSGIRLAENFYSADWIALDFDDPGTTLNEAREIFRDYQGIIGTTRNHQKPKEKRGVMVVCDRFRVVLRLSSTVYSSETFKSTVKSYQLRYKTDASAVDAARFFFHCFSVEILRGEKTVSHIIPQKPSKKSTPINYRKPMCLSRETQMYLSTGYDTGCRHESAKRAAIELARYGYGEDYIANAIKIGIPQDRVSHGEHINLARWSVKNIRKRNLS